MKAVNRIRVYIVEDSPVIRERWLVLLSDLGGNEIVGEAESATAAVAGIQELAPDLVILDLQLVQGTGFEVLAQINRLQPPPRVMVVTNFAEPQYRQKCLSAGADWFFDKSTEYEQAQEVLRRLVQHEEQ